MKAVHFFYCPFTGLGIRGGYRGDKWLANRIRVFNQFVLPALLNQTDKSFVLWISWRPEERHNPIVKQWEAMLRKIRDLEIVFTYGGVCFWDDKYPKEVARERLMRSLENTLPMLRQSVGDAETVYVTIQPSDDMYLAPMNEKVLHRWQEHYDAIGFTRGYIMNYATLELAEYNPTTHPPFYTIRFAPETFLNPEKHYGFIGPYESHEYVPNHLRYGERAERGFIVGTHGENISTTWNHPYKGRTLEGKERDEVLLAAGIYFAQPVVVRRGMRLMARQILNILPFQDKIRSLYHKSKWQPF